MTDVEVTSVGRAEAFAAGGTRVAMQVNTKPVNTKGGNMSVITRQQQRQDEQLLVRFLVVFNLALLCVLFAIAYLQT